MPALHSKIYRPRIIKKVTRNVIYFTATNFKVEKLSALRNTFKLQSGISIETSVFFHHVTCLDIVLDGDINDHCGDNFEYHKPLISMHSTLH